MVNSNVECNAPHQPITSYLNLQSTRTTKAQTVTHADRSKTGETAGRGAALEATAGDSTYPLIILKFSMRVTELASFNEEGKLSLLLALYQGIDQLSH